ncbi:MAG: hypothetical protein IPP47_26650 [Bryobacterales bacterium]|nr:hypothetical protein [Bryobacterales bacterium]
MKPKIILAILAALILGGMSWYFIRPVTAADLLTALPPGEVPTVYVNVKAMRAAGLIEKIAGPETLEDPEYKRFVAATGFDYRQDLDAVVIASRPGDTMMVVAGTFDLERLATYAKANGGRCAGELCTVQGSTPQRQISWTKVRRRVLGLAVSADPMAATLLAGNAAQPAFPVPGGPTWVHIPGPALRPGSNLPPGVSALLSGLEGARYAQLSATPTEVILTAPCESEAQAGVLAARLTETTKTLRTMLAREKSPAGSLADALAGGEFGTEGKTLRGRWALKW